LAGSDGRGGQIRAQETEIQVDVFGSIEALLYSVNDRQDGDALAVVGYDGSIGLRPANARTAENDK
jgi:hypothetical protein